MFNPRTGAALHKTASEQGAGCPYVFVHPCKEFHAGGYYNDLAIDVYLHVVPGLVLPTIQGANPYSVPTAVVPTLPCLKVEAGTTGYHDFGASGLPLHYNVPGFALVLSSSASALLWPYNDYRQDTNYNTPGTIVVWHNVIYSLIQATAGPGTMEPGVTEDWASFWSIATAPQLVATYS
jgi:hypothetical protein